jgi:hypothetical protein
LFWHSIRLQRAIPALLLVLALAAGCVTAGAQQRTPQEAVAQVDAAVRQRAERLASYIVVEHYAIYRGSEQSRPVAEMTVKATFRHESGKSYQILSESGSGAVLRFGLHPLLEHERELNQPRNRELSLFTSANYRMEPRPGTEQRNGRNCTVISIFPRRHGTNLLKGTLWVDSQDGSIVHVEGVGSKNPSLLSGPARMTRDYAPQQGFTMALHARAESDTFMFGRIVVVIDYSDYKIETASAR